MSWNVTSSAGNQHNRNAPSSQTVPPRIHWQCCVPLPHCQRPVTVIRSPSTTPVPVGANAPPVTVSGSPKISSAAGGSRKNAWVDVLEAIIEHQPAAPSARASTSIAVSIVSGSASGPPYASARPIRIRSAATSASTVSAGNRRSCSATSANFMTSGATASAAATNPPSPRSFTRPPPGDRHRTNARGQVRARCASDQLRPCCTSTSWGRPSTRSATMLRCTWPVPPPIVKACENR